MKALLQAQTLQLRLIESASVNESCARDLLILIRKLTAAEANSLINTIDLLRNESEFLRSLSKDITRLCTKSAETNFTPASVHTQ